MAIDDFALTANPDPTGPIISHDPLGNTSSTDDRTAEATITGNDLVTTGDNRPALWYRVDGDGPFSEVYFASQDDDAFTFTIPGQPLGSTVDYYIAAADADGVTTDPANGGGENPPGNDPPATFHTYMVEFPPGLRVWTGQGDGTSWTDPENWDPEQVPGEGDAVVLDNVELAGPYTVELPGGGVTTTIESLSILPIDPEEQIALVLPSTNTASPGMSITGAGDALIINDGGIFVNQSGASAGPGLSVTNTIRINDGGEYSHNTDRATGGLTQSLSTAAGTEFGIFRFDLPGGGTLTPSMAGRTFGTVAFSDSDGQGASYNPAAGTAALVRGDLILEADVSANIPITVIHALVLVDGELTIVDQERPFTLAASADQIATVTNGDGSVVGDITYERFYHLAQDGWRMIGSPFSGINYSSLTESGFHTQGGAWAEFSQGEAVLYVWDAENDMWLPIDGPDASFGPGGGYIFYMFETDVDDNAILPNDWVIEGAENIEFQLPLVYNDNRNSARNDCIDNPNPGTFNLVSNPHAGNLNSSLLFAEASNVADYYATWDPEQGGVAGGSAGYVYFNDPSEVGGAGQYIAPFQAFFVEATGADPALDFAYAMKDNAAPMEVWGRPGRDEGPSSHVQLLLTGEDLTEGETYLIFDERASEDVCQFLVPRFDALAVEYAAVSFVGPHGRLLAFDARDLGDEPVTFDLAMHTTRAGTYSLSWPHWHAIPEQWSLVLTDNQTGEEVNMRDAEAYAFTSEATRSAREKGLLPPPGALVGRADGPPRFTVTARSGPIATDPGSGEYAFELAAAYPNPLSSSATVAFTLPESSDVALTVYDVLGRRVAVLADGEHAAGPHTVTLDGNGLASGVYVVRLSAGEHSASRRVTVVR